MSVRFTGGRCGLYDPVERTDFFFGEWKMKPRLTSGYVGSALSYDPETGIFTWKVRHDKAKQINTRLAGKMAGTINDGGYVVIGINRINYAAHRLAWLLMTGEWPGPIVDHKNGNTSDNRWDNLREATSAQSNFNQKTYASSGLKGAFYHKRDRK